MGILDNNQLAQQGDGGFWVSNDLLMNIEAVIGNRNLKRVVIDITYGKFVEVYLVESKVDQVLRAINLEDLMKGVPLSEITDTEPKKVDKQP